MSYCILSFGVNRQELRGIVRSIQKDPSFSLVYISICGKVNLSGPLQFVLQRRTGKQVEILKLLPREKISRALRLN